MTSVEQHDDDDNCIDSGTKTSCLLFRGRAESPVELELLSNLGSRASSREPQALSCDFVGRYPVGSSLRNKAFSNPWPLKKVNEVERI